MADIRKLFGGRIVVGHGAIGTELRRQADAARAPVELLNLLDPASVRAVHEAYRDAGSQVIVTNTFAANPLYLREQHLEDNCVEINETGVRLARQTAGPDCPVLASVGPLSIGMRHDDFTDAALRGIYEGQVSGLTGADAVLLETFTDLREAKAAIDVVTAAGLPFLFQFGNPGGGRARQDRMRQFTDLAVAAGAVAVGTNCQHPNDIVEVVEFLAGYSPLPVTVSANAGHPTIDRGSLRYEFAASEFARVAVLLADAGAALIGGCCGTTPAHVRALAAALAGRPVVRRRRIQLKAVAEAPVGQAAGRQNRVRSLMQSSGTLISVEIRADRKKSAREIVKGAALIADAGADMFDVPDNPGATVGRDAMVIAAKLQQELGVPSICHKAAIQANLLKIHSSLLGCWDLGLEGILVVTGDVPSMGHLAGLAKPVTDLKSSVEMLRLLRGLRDGRMVTGEDVGDAPDFCAGCAVGAPAGPQFNWLAKKIEAGAEFVFSQPVFDIETYVKLAEGLAGLSARFLPGIMPLTGRKNAEFFAAGRIPGIRIPEHVQETFRGLPSSADERRFGLECAARLALEVAGRARGVYIIMPFGKNCYEETAEIVRAVRKAC